MSRKQNPKDANFSGDLASDNPVQSSAPAEPVPPPAEKKNEGEDAPPWAAPLRDLYQQVVEEPLPDFLSDLLSRLDRESE